MVAMVRTDVYPGRFRTGTEVADDICNQILIRRLPAGRVGIQLQNFGNGGVPGSFYLGNFALAYHPADSLADRTVYDWFRTPWMSNGIAQTRAWMDEFIARYRYRQSQNPNLPDPTRFIFDTELQAVTCCDYSELTLFSKIRQDPRWFTETVPGCFDSQGRPQTLEQLYTAAGRPYYVVGYDMSDVGNRPWSRWYMGICAQAVDGAMDAAVYQRVRAAWPTCQSSDFLVSMRTDGGGSPARVYRDLWWWGPIWQWYSWKGLGDRQSPVIYPVHFSFAVSGESWFDATLRVVRGNIESAVDSFGGGKQGELSPWIPLPGQRYDIGFGPTSLYTVTETDFRRLMAMFRAEGVADFYVWNDAKWATDAGWSAVASAARQVWGASVSSYQVSLGTETTTGGNNPARLAMANNDPVQVTTPLPGFTGEITVTFSTPFRTPAPPQQFLILIESWSSELGTSGSAWIRNYSGGTGGPVVWDPLPDFSVGTARTTTDSAAAARILDTRAAAHIAPDGTVQLRLRHLNYFVSAQQLRSTFDLVQLIEQQAGVPCPGDIDGNGAVGANDIALLMGAFGSVRGGPNWLAAADLDSDGSVGAADFTILLANVGCTR
ncbi:MAG: hypothetical protein IBJ11_00115 [Phycisphaerales bacterium]|nr:hypothetical protein [Phycisphaerales bacterium]